MPQRNILKTRRDFLSLIPKKSVGVEVGVFKGSFADEMLSVVDPIELYLIDPWLGKIHSGDKDGKIYEFIDDGDFFYHNELVPKYKKDNRVRLIKKTSGVLREFHDNFFDWAYVDGNHSYLGVTHDLELLKTKVKPNGIIMGHDYKIPKYYSVVKAVNDFCKKYSLSIEYLSADGYPSYFIRNN